jgi:menaquinol-cytochrome c reductase iron-sulfur subunit
MSEVTTRRGFFVAAIYGCGAAIAASLGLPALAYLLLPPKVRKEDEWIEAGDISNLAVNSPVELTFRRTRTDGWKVTSEKGSAWAVKQPDGNIVAFGPQCTHLGCPYHWEEEKKDFLCPCHTSVFAVDGSVVSGPAPRPLERYQTKLQGSKLLLGQLGGSTEKEG